MASKKTKKIRMKLENDVFITFAALDGWATDGHWFIQRDLVKVNRRKIQARLEAGGDFAVKDGEEVQCPRMKEIADDTKDCHHPVRLIEKQFKLESGETVVPLVDINDELVRLVRALYLPILRSGDLFVHGPQSRHLVIAVKKNRRLLGGVMPVQMPPAGTVCPDFQEIKKTVEAIAKQKGE